MRVNTTTIILLIQYYCCRSGLLLMGLLPINAISQMMMMMIIIIIITNERIKVMMSRKRCRGTLQDYNKGEISKCQSKLLTNRNVFSWCLNGTREETVRRNGGRLDDFHSRMEYEWIFMCMRVRSNSFVYCTFMFTVVFMGGSRNFRKGPVLPLLFLFPSPFPFLSPLLPLPLKVGPINQVYAVWGSAVSSPSTDRSVAPAENEFGAF